MLSEVVLFNVLNELWGGLMRNEFNICSIFVEIKVYVFKFLIIIGYNWFNL